MFANGTAAMTFCWNASNEATYAEQVTFTPYAMNFPTDDGKVELCGGIWGFGIFDNGDDAKIEAAKTFIKFICDDSHSGPASVQLPASSPCVLPSATCMPAPRMRPVWLSSRPSCPTWVTTTT